MNIRNLKEQEPLFEEKRITKLVISIDFEREVKIREKVFEIEKKLKHIFKNPAVVAPVAEDREEQVPRLHFSTDNSHCFFSQVRMEYHINFSKEEGKSIEQHFEETENHTREIFGAFQVVTGKKITRMGIVSDTVVPFRKEDNVILYLQKTFFKFNFDPRFTGLDFHIAYRYQDRYNVNIFVVGLKSAKDQNEDALLVKLDINDYFDQEKRSVPYYELNEIEKVFELEKNFALDELDKILRNKFIPENE